MYCLAIHFHDDLLFRESSDFIGFIKVKYSAWYSSKYGNVPRDYLASFSKLVEDGYNVSLLCLREVKK